MVRKEIEQKVTKLIESEVESLGFELVDVEFVKEGSSRYLRVYIDKDEGVSIDDCSLVSREIDKIIDLNKIDQHDFLEVSSPGIERSLKSERDFEKYKGEEVQLKLFKAVDGKKIFEGKLIGLVDGNIIIEDSEKVLTFSKEKVSLIKRVFKF